jgi:hypothetical protein
MARHGLYALTALNRLSALTGRPAPHFDAPERQRSKSFKAWITLSCEQPAWQETNKAPLVFSDKESDECLSSWPGHRQRKPPGIFLAPPNLNAISATVRSVSRKCVMIRPPSSTRGFLAGMAVRAGGDPRRSLRARGCRTAELRPFLLFSERSRKARRRRNR